MVVVVVVDDGVAVGTVGVAVPVAVVDIRGSGVVTGDSIGGSVVEPV